MRSIECNSCWDLVDWRSSLIAEEAELKDGVVLQAQVDCGRFWVALKARDICCLGERSRLDNDDEEQYIVLG